MAIKAMAKTNIINVSCVENNYKILFHFFFFSLSVFKFWMFEAPNEQFSDRSVSK